MKPTASKTLTMLREPGALANWIHEMSGLEGVEFAPPVVSNITSLYERVQTELNQRLEEESADFHAPETVDNHPAPEIVVIPQVELDQFNGEYEAIGEYTP